MILRFLRHVRSAVSFGLVIVFMGVVGWPWMAALGLVGRFVSPRRRLAWVSIWTRRMSAGVLRILGLGGAHYSRVGCIRSDQPGIVVMNHQSVLDIPTAAVMCLPLMLGFVSRQRYTAAPMIGTGLWLADCPVIDPHRDREAAIAVLRRAAWQDRMLLIFPEGHRSKDGELRPFRTAGLLAILEERRLPVFLVATDGYSPGRKLWDFVFNVHAIQGRTELVGRFEPPGDAVELPAFLDQLHKDLGAALARIRAQRLADAGALAAARPVP